MAVSQSVVFVGANTQASTLSSDPLALWTSNGVSATEVIPEPDSMTPGYLGTQPGLSYYFLDGAPVPGSLVFAFSTSNGDIDQLYATNPVTGTPQLLNVPNLATSLTYTMPGPRNLTAVGSIVLFSARDTGGLSDLWRSDGTAAGTVVVPVPGASASGVNPQTLTAFGDNALFIGSGADNATDLFFTDGTTAGTREIAALPRVYGPGQTIFQVLGVAGGRAIFLGPGSAANMPGLYATDGTAAGTVAITLAPSDLTQAFTSPAPPGTTGTLTSAVGGRVLFSVSGGQNTGLYATDGTAAGTVEISPIQATELVSLGNEAVFASNTGSIKFGVTDGTAAGTTALTVAGLPSGDSLSASNLTRLGNQVLFFGSDTAANSGTDGSSGLWITDGTSAGTREIAPDVFLDRLTVVAGASQAYFSGPGGLLYVTDGTAAGTHSVPGTAGLDSDFITIAPSPLAFTGTQADYALAPTAAGELQTRDLTTPGAAPLNLPDARVLTFADGSAALVDPTGNAQDIARIYLAAYDRAPDLGGLLAYTQQLDNGTVSLARIAAAAPVSAQFLSTYGTLSNAQFVSQLYENADGRAPDPGGLSAYTGALASGQTRGQVLLSFAESPEARVHSQAVAGNANDATITQLYEAIDARAPDPGGLVSYASALDGGQSVAQIAAAMLSSGEYTAKFGTPTNAAFVTNLYHNLLDRAPDPGGLASYTADLAGGESRAQLVAGFINSDEAKLATAPLTHLGIVTVS